MTDSFQAGYSITRQSVIAIFSLYLLYAHFSFRLQSGLSISWALAYILRAHSFSPITPTPRGCTQLPLVLCRSCRLHCILQNGRDNRRQLRCLQRLPSCRQVDCARKKSTAEGSCRTYKIFCHTLIA